ncbi:MAG: YihY/virulence factor BrkB family protein [Candidatus Eremiobacteraeota bacterium]|nr:YihY/virulence factor BrkB family protein [Candidatus Eremiobacteraeota bacterium]
MIALVKETLAQYQRHKAQWLAAAIAYFTTFAIAPLIIVVVEILGFVLGQHRGTLAMLHAYLQQNAGRAAADGIDAIVAATFAQRRAGTIAQIVGWFVFVLGAVGLFSALQDALNTIWDVEAQKRTLWGNIRERASSFAVVVGIALLLLVSLLASTALTAAGPALRDVFPAFPAVAKIADFVISFVVVAVLFGIIYAYLPDCRISWRDVWVGAAISALLFVTGQSLLGWYLGHAAIANGYGAFGGLVVFMVWVNYSAQIVLFGAEFTHVYARRTLASGHRSDDEKRLGAAGDRIGEGRVGRLV